MTGSFPGYSDRAEWVLEEFQGRSPEGLKDLKEKFKRTKGTRNGRV